MNVETMDPRMAQGLEELNIRSILIIPIITGSKIWGNLILADGQIRDFNSREISMALNVAIIIGLSLRNYNTMRFSDMVFDALGRMKIGVFILQNGTDSQPYFQYCNEAFSKICEIPKDKITELSSISPILTKESLTKLMTAYQARQNGKVLPMAYRINLSTKSGPKHVLLSLTTGELNDKIATFGFALDLQPEKSPWIDDVYRDLVNE
jgi:hypothetical protein